MGATAVGGRGGANDDETLDVLLTVVGTVDPPIIPALLSPLDRSRNLASESTDVDGIGGCTDGSGRMG